MISFFNEDLNDATYYFLHKSTRMVLALESGPGRLAYIKKLKLKRHALRNVKTIQVVIFTLY